MCVIVYKPAGVEVDIGVLKNCWEANPHGAGIMFPRDDKLIVSKGFMKWRSMKRYVKRNLLKTGEDVPIAFHFRIATHGSIVERNTHPFKINDNLAMMHNGVIRKVDKYIDSGEDVSDSEAFARRFVKDAFSGITIYNLSSGMPINDLFKEYIGSSKLLFMDNHGEVAIVNEAMGSWLKDGIGSGMWFSNTLWKPRPKATSTMGTGKRTVITWQNGKKIAKEYDPTGRLLKTTEGSAWEPKPPKDLEGAPGLLQSGYDEDYYCYDCAMFFLRSESKRTYWTNGLTKRIVDCPMCGQCETEKADDLFEGVYDQPSNESEMRCYDCGHPFSKEEAEETMVSADQYGHECPICKSTDTYSESEEGVLVEKFGDDYFRSQLYERGL